MAQEKKYKITLDYKVYESDNLHELEKLAIDYNIQEEGFPLYLNSYNYNFHITEFTHKIYEPENIFVLTYNNYEHIEVRKDLLTKKELNFIKQNTYDTK